MRLLRDEQAYHRLLEDFVAHRVDASAFMRRFQTLWDGDRADGVASVLAMQHAGHGQAGLYGLLDSVSALCATYLRCLPEDCGYRVSEEQFRKEIEGRLCEWPPV